MKKETVIFTIKTIRTTRTGEDKFEFHYQSNREDYPVDEDSNLMNNYREMHRQTMKKNPKIRLLESSMEITI